MTSIAPVAEKEPELAPAPVADEPRDTPEALPPETGAERARFQLPYSQQIARLGVPPETPKAEVEKPAEPTRYFRVVAQDAGTLLAGDKKIHLDGLNPLALDARCGANGKAWPCGRAARAALRRFIRGRAVVCSHTAEREKGEVVAHCTVAGTDIGDWLVRYGWATPAADAAEKFSEALELARNEMRGQWKSANSARPPSPTSRTATQ